MCYNLSFRSVLELSGHSERKRSLEEQQAQTTVIMIPTIVYLCCVAILGIIGNSLILFVYNCRFSRSAVRIFIMATTVFDLLINTLVIPAETYDIFHAWDFDHPSICRVRRFFNAQTTMGSGFLLVALAFTRYRKICRPFDRQVKIKEAKLICGLTVLTSLTCAAPYAIINGSQTTEPGVDGVSGCKCSVDDSYVNTKWPVVNSSFFVLIFLTCCTTLFVLYVLIAQRVRSHARNRRRTVRQKAWSVKADRAANIKDWVATSIPHRADVNLENKMYENGVISDCGRLQQSRDKINMDEYQPDRPNLLMNEESIQVNMSVLVEGKTFLNSNRSLDNPPVKCLLNKCKLEKGNEDPQFPASTSRMLRDAKETACGVTPETACGVTKETAWGVTKETACGVTKETACGVKKETACGVTKETACGVTKETACGVTKETACGVKKETAWGVTKQNNSTTDVTRSEELNTNPLVDGKEHCLEVTTTDDTFSDDLESSDVITDSDISSEEPIETDEEDPTAEKESTSKVGTLRPRPSQVRQHFSTKRVHSSKSRTRRNGRQIDATTWMLLTLSVVFVGGYLPFLSLEFISSAAPGLFLSMGNASSSVYQLFRRSYFLNSAINPVIYCLCDLSFRRECLAIFKGQ